jgi:hypothetical protein
MRHLWRRTAPATGLTVFVSLPALGAYQGLTWELDPFGLDGQTPLSRMPGYGGQVVINVYATFNDPTDQCIGVFGTHRAPFLIWGCGDALQNAPAVTGDDAPAPAEAQFLPSANWDTFYTIGRKVEPYSTPLIVVPGTPGPATNPWPPAGSPAAINMGWSLPPLLHDGTPPPETLAGDDGRVLIARLAIAPGANPPFFGVNCAIAVIADGSAQLVPGVLAGLHCDAFDPCPDIAVSTCCIFAGCCEIDVMDLVEVILHWGEAGGSADVNHDGTVDVADLTQVIDFWGPCI